MTYKKLALFDLDHTLLPLDSDYQWAIFMAETGRAGDPAEALRRNQELMDRYNAGELTAEQAAEFMLGLLAAHPPHLLAACGRDRHEQLRDLSHCTRLWYPNVNCNRTGVSGWTLHRKDFRHAQLQAWQGRSRPKLASKLW